MAGAGALRVGERGGLEGEPIGRHPRGADVSDGRRVRDERFFTRGGQQAVEIRGAPTGAHRAAGPTAAVESEVEHVLDERS